MGTRSEARLPIHPRSPARPISKTECPLCGASNQCGAAAGEESCWCFEASIDPQVLRQIPEAAQGVACICRACATSTTVFATEKVPR